MRSRWWPVVITILLIVFLLGANSFPHDGVRMENGLVRVEPRPVVSAIAGVLGIWLWFLYIRKKP